MHRLAIASYFNAERDRLAFVAWKNIFPSDTTIYCSFKRYTFRL